LNPIAKFFTIKPHKITVLSSNFARNKKFNFMTKALTLILAFLASFGLQAQQQSGSFTLIENYSFDCLYANNSTWWSRLRKHHSRENLNLNLNFSHSSSLQRYNRELNYTIKVTGAQVQYSPNYRLFPTQQFLKPTEVCLKVELYRQTDGKVMERKWLSSSSYSTYYSGGEASLRYTYRDTMENADYELHIIQSEWNLNFSDYELSAYLRAIDEYYEAAEETEKHQTQLFNLANQARTEYLEDMEDKLKTTQTFIRKTEQERFWSSLRLDQLDALDPIGLRRRLQALKQLHQSKKQQYLQWIEKLPELYYQEAQTAYAQGDSKVAKRKAQRASEERASYAGPQLLLARIALDAQQIEEFKKALQKALNSCQPNYAEQQEAQGLATAYYNQLESEIRQNVQRQYFNQASRICKEAKDWFNGLNYINKQQNAFEQLEKYIKENQIKQIEAKFQASLRTNQSLLQSSQEAMSRKDWASAHGQLDKAEEQLQELKTLSEFPGAKHDLATYRSQEKEWIKLSYSNLLNYSQALIADKNWEKAYALSKQAKTFIQKYGGDNSYWTAQNPNIIEQTLKSGFELCSAQLLSTDSKEIERGMRNLKAFQGLLNSGDMPPSPERKAAWEQKLRGLISQYLSQTTEYLAFNAVAPLRDWMKNTELLAQTYNLSKEPAVLQTLQKAEQHRCKLSNTAIAQKEQQLELDLQNRKFVAAFDHLQGIKTLVAQEQNCPPDLSQLLAKEGLISELRDYELALNSLKKAQNDKNYEKAFQTLIRLHGYHQKPALQTHIQAYPYGNWQQYVEQQNQSEYSYQAALYLATVGELDGSFRYLKNALTQGLNPKTSQSLQERLGFELGKKDHAPKASRSPKLSERIGGMEKKFTVFQKAYTKGWKAAK
jgi:hypothetical protein